MEDATHDPLADALHELRAIYLGEAPERVRELSAALGRLRLGQPDALNDLHLYFHRLAGSGGSYGFPDITDCSRSAEHAVQRLVSSRRAVENADLAGLEQYVLDLAAAFAAAQRAFDQGKIADD